jgi:hypothetical protein
MVKRILLASTFALLGAASAVQASPADDRWLPWLGCWRAADAPAGNLLCIVPDAAGVRLIELANGTTVRESRTVADGQARPVSQEGCTGTELSRWSGDAERLYLTSDMTCGERTRRQTTGVFAFVSGTEWISVQSVSASGLEPGTKTVRYVSADASGPEALMSALRANRLARETSRYAMTKPLDLDDVREAIGQVHAKAVEGLIVARNQPFDLNGKQLLALARAGVPESVIDVLVAVSNPGRFAVRDPTTAGEERPRGRNYAGRYCDEWDSWYDSYCGGSRYGSYNYSPYGYYSPFGYNGYGWRYGNTPVIIVRGSDDDTGDQGRGRATRQGYSRGRSTEPSSSVGSSSSGSSSSGSSSKGSSSSSGSSSGSTSTGRTAKPRGGSN